MDNFKHYQQLDEMDCGPCCLKMITKHFGKNYTLEELRERCFVTKQGTSLFDLSYAAESLGFKTLSAYIDFDTLVSKSPLPLIAFIKMNHFVVVHKTTTKKVYVADPAIGKYTLSKNEFIDIWANNIEQGRRTGVVLLFESTNQFESNTPLPSNNKISINKILLYIKPYKRYLVLLFLGLLIGTSLEFALPFLSQILIDKGVNNRDLKLVNIILIAQIVIYITEALSNVFRSWIYMHIGSRINLSLVSNYLAKLMKLPLSYFDTRTFGDIMQRMDDNRRIETFLTSTLMQTIYGIFTTAVLGTVLAIYSLKYVSIFLIGWLLYLLWVLLFQKARKMLDINIFENQSQNKNLVQQMFEGIQDIKLHNSEALKRWEWERNQTSLFKSNVRMMSLGQYQSLGSTLINQLKYAALAYTAAKSVINGEISFGTMVAIQFISGQLSAPMNSFIDFIQSYQFTKISFNRIRQIFSEKDEDTIDSTMMILPENKGFILQSVSFQYGNPKSPFVLKDLNTFIAHGKTTAIVGESGSGKTTLVKLLLKLYKPRIGVIGLGGVNLNNINNRLWRSKCAAILQDSYLFSDTIIKNICLGQDKIDKDRLYYATKLANIKNFIESLPFGYYTKIGANGQGLSKGQIQRILIARAIYKNPEFIFFDEATNSLDANNEMIIINNLKEFFKGKTVVIVAHRLSTIRDADKILVMNKGKIVEWGDHNYLINRKGYYYELVKNQLDILIE